MKRIGLASIALLMLLVVGSSAQVFVGPGSTVQGDYLRGVGVAAWGLGLYNLNTALADQIEVQNYITLNEYIASVKAAELARQARLRAQRKAERLKWVRERRERILNSPQALDIRNGDSLNSAINALTRGGVTLTDLRLNPIPLPADVVRRLPFKLNEEGKTLSLPRMLHQGIGAWPVAFQDDRYSREKAAYERAISNAIDQQIDGKVTHEAIDRLERAVEALVERFDELDKLRPDDRNLLNPARNHLSDLKKSVALIKSAKIERIVADLDTYQGATVHDLVLFMIKHKVTFAEAEMPDERRAYREVYAALSLQRTALPNSSPGGFR